MAALQKTLARPRLDTDVVPFTEYRKNLSSFFKQTAETFDRYEFPEIGRLPASIRYGVTQAILEGVSKIKHCTMCEVVLEEYNLPIDLTPVRLNAQSGDERYINVDKMILKKVGMMPHGLINNVEKKLGAGDGKIFLNYSDFENYYDEDDVMSITFKVKDDTTATDAMIWFSNVKFVDFMVGADFAEAEHHTIPSFVHIQ